MSPTSATALACACLLLTSCASSSGSRPPPAKVDLPTPGHLPPQAREMLHSRMERHGESMTWLMATVLLLKHDLVQELANEIASEPRFSRPIAGEADTLNALLPARFFELQDQLRDRASALVAAAKAKDDGAMAKAYGALAETCVSCHSTYLAGEAETGNGKE